MTMQPHQQRVIDEKAELDEKILKLSAFIDVANPIFASLPEAERGRLCVQADIMGQYSQILKERIEAFTP